MAGDLFGADATDTPRPPARMNTDDNAPPPGGGGGAPIPDAGAGGGPLTDAGEQTPPLGMPRQPVPPAGTGTFGRPGSYGASSGVLPRDPAQQRETVRVTDGDRTIEVSGRVGAGGLELTIDDGRGEPRSHDIDLSPGAARQGDGGAAGHVGAGADGKAVIHDGDSTLTVERRSADGEFELTVDDGAGQPRSYTLRPDAAGAGPTHVQGLFGGPSESLPTGGGPGVASVGVTDAVPVPVGADTEPGSGRWRTGGDLFDDGKDHSNPGLDGS